MAKRLAVRGTINDVPVFEHRGKLARTQARIQAGEVRVGFLGGSITDPRNGWNWPEAVTSYLVSAFPSVRFIIENAAQGATGSDSAVFRAQRDIIDRGCDLVFVEYTVNDSGVPTDRRNRSREGLIRKLLAEGPRDIVLAYTFCRGFYDELIAGKIPASVQEFEAIGRHYNIGSVWLGVAALREVLQGGMRWEEWLPDGIHPQFRGSYSYAQAAATFLQRELIESPSGSTIAAGPHLPKPLCPRNWQHTSAVPLEAVRTGGPWSIRRWPMNCWIDRVLATSAPTASLEFAFKGRGVAIGTDHGTAGADFRYRIDRGAWTTISPIRASWCGPCGWHLFHVLADDLRAGEHTVQIEVLLSDKPDAIGTNFRLAQIGVIE